MEKKKRILVTGANGFVGKNLIEGLLRFDNLEIFKFDIENTVKDLEDYISKADFIYHLAGVNRPAQFDDFYKGNTDLTKQITELLIKFNKKTPLVFTSSSYAKNYETFKTKDENSPNLYYIYGASKKYAEDALLEYSKKTSAHVYIYQLNGLFGKWARPNYNTVVATFCYNIAQGKEITISDKNKELELTYIDDVVSEFITLLNSPKDKQGQNYFTIAKIYKVTLGNLAERIQAIHAIHNTLTIPDLSDGLNKCLYATYLSYLEPEQWSYYLDEKKDQRGCLAELLKSKTFGQIFISKSYKGVTRGNHYHNTKIEKFCVIQGKAEVRLRHIFSDQVISIIASGDKISIIDIPPGYTHSITNLLEEEMIVLFWANEIFNPDAPDTYFKKVSD